MQQKKLKNNTIAKETQIFQRPSECVLKPSSGQFLDELESTVVKQHDKIGSPRNCKKTPPELVPKFEQSTKEQTEDMLSSSKSPVPNAKPSTMLKLRDKKDQDNEEARSESGSSNQEQLQL